MLGDYFAGVEVVDLALSGRSSKSFKKEANYTTLKNSLKRGDYLLIQFGHNDNKADAFADPGPDRFAEGSFQHSMLEYVELAWEKGAKPVIATSISRRKLSDESLEAYVTAASKLAAELSVPCIDLYAATNGWINQVGVEAAQDMFNCVKPHDTRFIDYPGFAGSEFYEKGSSDDTHLNIYGANLIAQWCAEAIRTQALPLAGALIPSWETQVLPSYAEAAEAGAGVGTPGTGESASLFPDVRSADWYYPGVKSMVERELMNGTDKGFEPGAGTTRAMVATVLWRLAGKPAASVSAAERYWDVRPGQWYTAAIDWCVGAGLLEGYAQGFTMGVDDPITREQLCVLLSRFGQFTGAMGEFAGADFWLTDFADNAAVSAWARDRVAWGVEQGLISGKPGKLLDPQGQVTRAELAVILERFLTRTGR